MNRRHFLQLAAGMAAVASVPAAAMPILTPPQPSELDPEALPGPAIATEDDLRAALAEPVQWRRCWINRRGFRVCRGGPGWRRRYWRRRWRRRYRW
jgi:hypothetical protein